MNNETERKSGRLRRPWIYVSMLLATIALVLMLYEPCWAPVRYRHGISAPLRSIMGLTETNGGLLYGTADDTYAWLAAGAEGTLLMGNGAGAPSFLAAGATTEILVGGGAADPVWTTATGTGAPVRAGSPTLTGTAVVAGIDGSGTISGNLFTPDAADGADIGTAALEFSDVYLADGSIIKLGNDQDVTITHVADTALEVNLAVHNNVTVLDDSDIASDNISAAQAKRGVVITNDGKGGVSDYNIPAGVKGMVIYVFAEEAAVITLDLADSDDIIVLPSGALAAGNAIDSDGNLATAITLVCHTGDGGTAVSYWYVHAQVGVWADGGAD